MITELPTTPGETAALRRQPRQHMTNSASM